MRICVTSTFVVSSHRYDFIRNPLFKSIIGIFQLGIFNNIDFELIQIPLKYLFDINI